MVTKIDDFFSPFYVLSSSREQLVRALRTRQEREERRQFDGQGDQTM